LALGGSAWGVEGSESIQGLISHWKFDEGQGSIAYDSVGGNDGWLVSSPVWTGGIIDGALDFDGVDDYVDVGDPIDGSLDFGAADSFSISAWVKTTDENGQIVYKKRCTGVGGYYKEGYRLRLSFGHPYFGIEDTSNNGISILGDTMVTDDQWHHVVTVRDTATNKLYLYLDGSPDAIPVTDITIGTLATDRSLEIGRADATVSPGLSYHAGKIDDVRIYNRALSPEEIQQLYLPGAGPVSHWKFDEGQGLIAYDSAGNNDGTIYRAEWTTGIIDGALDFDGVDDYVSVPDDSSLDFTSGQSFSVATWFRIEAGDASGQPILQKYSNSNRSGYALFGNSGSVSGRIAFVTWGTGEIFVLDEGEYNDGNWHYAVGVRNQYSGIIQLYINGVEVDTNNEPTRSLANSANLSIGTNWTGNSDYHGKIDDVRIYNRALSAEEIQQLYQGEFADLVGLEIVGPDEVAENFRAGYKAIAYYDNDSTKDVTNSALWAVEPDTYASINRNGILTTKDIVKDQSATILASYTKGDVTFDAEKAIDILAICPTGTALQFDGVDDYVDVGDIGVTGDWTVEFWAKLDTVAPSIQYPIGTGLGAATRPAGIFMAYSKAEAGRWGIYDGVSYHVGSVVSAGVWYDVAVTKSGTTYTLYLNGNFENDVSLADIDISNLQIGRRSDNRWYVDGLIDEVRIYNRALSAEEIQANMHRRLAGDEPNLVGYWDFDEGEGQIVYDLSGNGNDGHLGSTPKPDVRDPAWVKSYAPVGICTPYQIATKAAERALERKLALLEELLGTLAEEWTAYEAFEELLESGDYGDLNKGDIVTAKQKIRSAIQHQEQAIDALEKSIEKLKDALSALGYEPEPPVPNQPPNVNITNPQDGAVFDSYQTIEIEANAWDVDGSVVKVEFFANGSKIGEDNDGTDGWKTNWYDLPVGTYILTAKATDNDGAAATSPAVRITVHGAPPPPPPPGSPPV